jgi:hypothetical protein
VPTVEVTFDKYVCTVNALEAPAPEIGTPGDNCSLSTDPELFPTFMLSIDGQAFTTAELLAGVQLAPGDYDLYEGTTFVGTITVVDADQTINVLNYIATTGAGVIVNKWFCEDIDDVVGGIDMEAPGDECVPGTADFDILDSEGASVLGAGDDVFAGVTLPAGEYTLAELGSGFTLDFSLGAEQGVPINVFNPVEEEEPWITVQKFFCEGDNSEGNVSNCNGREAPDVDVTFTVVGNGVDDTIVVEEFNQGNGSQGQASSDFALEAGETYLVCEIEPDGWMGVARALGASQTAGETPNCVYVTLTPGNNQVQFNNFMRDVPVDETGTLIVTKYFCTDEGITVPVVVGEGDYEGCELATAEQLEGVNFLVLPFKTEPLIDITESMLLSTGVVLPVGTHTLVEGFEGVIHELADVTIEADETKTIIVLNPIDVPEDEEITVNIWKAVCSEIDVDADDPCVSSDGLNGTEIGFTVTYTVGETDITVDTSLVVEGDKGSAVLTLPLAESYTVCEDVPDGVEEVTFGILGVDDAEATADGCITFSAEGLADGDVVGVMFWNDLEDEKSDKPVPPKKPVVIKLPSTGSGSADTGANAPIMLIAAAAAAAGAGAILRKERPAA